LSHRYRFDRFEILPAARQLLDEGALVNLGARAFDLLQCLVENSHRIVTKDELIDRVWPGLVVTENNLSVQVSTLRRLLGPEALVNVSGRGYQFMLPVTAGAQSVLATDALLVASPIAPPDVEDIAARNRRKGDAAVEEQSITPVTLTLPDKPSIAVLPFLNLSSDAQQDYFADAISEDITTELSRFKALFVIARNSAFTYKGRAVDVRTISRELGVRYVLEGSVRRSGDRVRVTAQLIDAFSGNHLWAEKYDRVLADVFDVQEEVTQSIVGAMAPHIHAAEQNLAKRLRPGNLKAHDLAMRANANSNDAIRRHDPVLWQQALDEARAAVAMDASSVLALTVIAELNARYVGAPQFDEQDLSLPWKEGVAAAGQAIDLDPVASPAYRWMGFLLALGGFYDEGCSMARRGVEVNPNDAIAWSNLAFSEVWSGHPEEALAHQAQAVRLSPRDPNQYLFNTCRSLACFELKDYAQAMVYARMAAGAAPNSPGPQVALAMAAVGAGELALAKSAHAFFSQLCPAYTRRVMSGDTTFGNPEHRRRAILALRIAAGLEDAGAAAGLH
jgi:adenylate cyclase